MVIRRIFPVWVWATFAALFLAICLGLSGAFTVYWVHSVVSNECAALNLLTNAPAPKPSNPTANPSRQLNYQFHQDLVFWAHRDGCQ